MYFGQACGFHIPHTTWSLVVYWFLLYIFPYQVNLIHMSKVTGWRCFDIRYAFFFDTLWDLKICQKEVHKTFFISGRKNKVSKSFHSSLLHNSHSLIPHFRIKKSQKRHFLWKLPIKNVKSLTPLQNAQCKSLA